MQLLQTCQLHIHDASHLLHHIPKALCWIEMWELWGPCEDSELIVLLKKPV